MCDGYLSYLFSGRFFRELKEISLNHTVRFVYFALNQAL